MENLQEEILGGMEEAAGGDDLPAGEAVMTSPLARALELAS